MEKEINNIVGRYFKDDNYYTYDHLLPDGTGDDFSSQEGQILYEAAKSDKRILKNDYIESYISLDDMNLPVLQVV